jgi:tetratricopeptide (TPR) repeat protein
LIEESKNEKDEILKSKMLNEAKTYLQKGLKIYPEYVAGWVLLGINYLYLEDYDLANNCYENCLKLSKNYPYAITNLNSLGQITYKKKNYDMSIKAFKILLKYQGEKAETYYWLGMGYSEKNKIDSALYFLNASLKIDSNYYQSYNKIGEIYGKSKNDLKSSLYYLLKAYKINQNDVQILQNIGVAYGISGNFDESILYLNKAIKLDSTNYELYYNLGGSYMGLKDLEKAKTCFTKADLLKSSKPK